VSALQFVAAFCSSLSPLSRVRERERRRERNDRIKSSFPWADQGKSERFPTSPLSLSSHIEPLPSHSLSLPFRKNFPLRFIGRSAVAVVVAAAVAFEKERREREGRKGRTFAYFARSLSFSLFPDFSEREGESV